MRLKEVVSVTLTRRDDLGEEHAGYYEPDQAKRAADFFLLSFPGAYLRAIFRPATIGVPDEEEV